MPTRPAVASEMRCPGIDVLVTFGNCQAQPERAANLRFVMQNLVSNISYPNWRLVVAEMSSEPTQREAVSGLGGEYVFIPAATEFSPGAAQTTGFLQRTSPNELVYFHQADFLVPPRILESALDTMNRLNCPFVYPYWGEVHLSRPVSSSIRQGEIDAAALYERICSIVDNLVHGFGDADFREAAQGYRELLMSPAQRGWLEELLPGDLRSCLAGLDAEELWGHDDRAYAPYRWPAPSGSHSRVCRISPGPRASAAYLCRDTAFREVGGVPALPGWGYEDLIAWLNVQSFFAYRADRDGVYFADVNMSAYLPLVHLWHPIGSRPGYYAHTSSNESRYLRHARLAPAERRATVRPLPPSSG